ncbi:response regulator [Thermodesulforhabdus norvegica]|uniref:Two-component system, chemotaxis family, response regulator CheY n=1 Tax=Thermodesulforhabdus norvegica TaxID=39841 RepID=A0A1I4REN9_9BACT|nr:response regulator [Thermodesulforhabdus norvegica]SFM50383.1 two-component system, chemotaxis family, response regulator CheY [Thermodesulforhabdus norvegica]
MSYNVLIVDDSRSMRKVIEKTLRISGFDIGEIYEASNGQEALEVLEKNWVDIILSDIHMPVMDGLKFLEELRKKEDYKDIPVVLITTEASEERLGYAMSLGAQGYIRKPFEPNQIREYLSGIMGEPTYGVAGTDEGCDF